MPVLSSRRAIYRAVAGAGRTGVALAEKEVEQFVQFGCRRGADMKEVRATLQLDLADHRNANAVTAGKALTAWAEALEEASRLIDPYGEVAIELVGTEAACIKLHAVFRYIEHSILDPAAAALAPYPRLKASLALNVFVLPGAIVGGVAVAMLTPHEVPPAAFEAAVAAHQRVQASPAATTKAQAFYGVVDRDPAIQGIKVFGPDDRAPIASVPRSQFGEHAGYSAPEEAACEFRFKEDTWDVVVTHPVALARKVKWGFTYNGLSFRAKVVDAHFLAALKARTLPLQVHEGALMRVRVRWTETDAGDHWQADTKTYEILEVLWPTPLDQPPRAEGPLFGKD